MTARVQHPSPSRAPSQAPRACELLRQRSPPEVTSARIDGTLAGHWNRTIEATSAFDGCAEASCRCNRHATTSLISASHRQGHGAYGGRTHHKGDHDASAARANRHRQRQAVRPTRRAGPVHGVDRSRPIACDRSSATGEDRRPDGSGRSRRPEEALIGGRQPDWAPFGGPSGGTITGNAARSTRNSTGVVPRSRESARAGSGLTLEIRANVERYVDAWGA